MSKRAAGDEEAEVSSKKKAKRDGETSDATPQTDTQLKKDPEGNQYLDLGGMKRATVNVFKGKAQINIREYYSDKNDEIKPGKKGITLNALQWELLVAGIKPLSQRLETIEAEKSETATKSKKKNDEKPTRTKKGEKSKKKKKEASDHEGSEDD